MKRRSMKNMYKQAARAYVQEYATPNQSTMQAIVTRCEIDPRYQEADRFNQYLVTATLPDGTEFGFASSWPVKIGVAIDVERVYSEWIPVD